jgi:hypothetical protein
MLAFFWIAQLEGLPNDVVVPATSLPISDFNQLYSLVCPTESVYTDLIATAKIANQGGTSPC